MPPDNHAATETMADGRDLILTRHLDAPPEAVYRAWTDPALLRQWFVPAPWTIARAELDVRPGGSSLIVMRSPEGEEMPNPGVYLDVVPDRRLVFTDAYTAAWIPSEKPFMTAIVTFDEEDGGTRYTARACHWSEDDRKVHEDMGFHDGWRQCAEHLAALLESQ